MNSRRAETRSIVATTGPVGRRHLLAFGLSSAVGMAGCTPRNGRFRDPDLVAFNEGVRFDPRSLERWNLYLTRLSIGVSGQWPDLTNIDVKRRLLARLAREHADVRTRVIVLLWQHYPEAYELLAAGRIAAGSCIDDAILLTTLIQRHMGEVSIDPAAQPRWERYVAALVVNPVRVDTAWRRFEPYVGRVRPAADELLPVRELAAEQEMRSPGPGIELRSTKAFWSVMIEAAEQRGECSTSGNCGAADRLAAARGGSSQRVTSPGHD